MKKISSKLFCIFVVVTVCFIFVYTVLSLLFLDKYYILKKKGTLALAQREIIERFDDSDEFALFAEELEMQHSMRIHILDQNARTVYSSRTAEKVVINLPANRHGVIEIRRDARFGTEELSTDTTFIYDENEYNLTLSASLTPIANVAGVTQSFVFLTGGLVLVIGLISTYFISKIISRPVNELNQLAMSVASLDFSKKLKVRSNDELGQLAGSINNMSETLESTIKSLAEANELLKDDIRRREQIDEMRKEFIANVSHELKTPLAIIGGYSEGLKENVNEDGRDEYCDIIISEVGRMNRLVYQLLDLSQLESGLSNITKTRICIHEMVNDFVERYAIVTEEKGISLGVVTETNDTVVFADEIRCEMVITNFINNAIAYLIEPKMVKITLKEVEGRLRFSVFNHCVPPPEEELEKIWDSFYKVDKSRKRAESGSGLGLHIVKIITAAHGTECGVVAKDDGLEFWADFELFGKDINEEEDS